MSEQSLLPQTVEQIPGVDKEFLDKIERLNIDIDEKGELILTKLGIKPAVWIICEIKIWNGDERPYVIQPEESVQTLVDGIKDLGLPYTITPRTVVVTQERISGRSVDVNTDRLEIRVGSNQDNLDFLNEALDVKDHEQMGIALGIPETAVEAFIGIRKSLNLYTLPKEVILGDPFLFTPTRLLSEDNWQEEIKEGERRAEALKVVSPRLFQRIRASGMRADENQGLLSDKVRRENAHK